MSDYGLTVELRPSIGEYESPIGPANVTHQQMEVWAGSKQVERNYGRPMVRVGMSSMDGKHINWESHAAKWPADAIQYIAAVVGKELGAEEPPTVSVPKNPVVNVTDLDDEIDVTDLDELDD